MTEERKAGEAMSTDLVVLTDELTAAEAVDILREHEISGAPVRDGKGKLVGVVSLADLAEATSDEGGLAFDRSSPQFAVRGWEETATAEEVRPLHLESPGRQVRDLMTPSPVTVTEEAPISEVAALMVEAHVHRVLVTREGEVVGIVTSLDVLKSLIGPG